MDSLDEGKIEKLAREFFEKLGVNPEISVTFGQEDTIVVSAQGEELGILIGYHGETLEALQLLLGLIVNKQLKLEPWKRLLLDVGGWRLEREEALKNLVQRAITRAEESRQSVDLPPMPASQRRFVHVLLSEREDIESHSELDGQDRHIVITFKG